MFYHVMLTSLAISIYNGLDELKSVWCLHCLVDVKSVQVIAGCVCNWIFKLVLVGEIIFDASWNDIGTIFMAEIKNGDFIFSEVSMDPFN